MVVPAYVKDCDAQADSTVVTGVETAGQLQRRVELGCDDAQGYHLAHPVAAAELEALLRQD